MAKGETYAHIDSAGGGAIGNRVLLRSDGTWEFSEGGDTSIGEWYKRTGSPLVIGVVSSIIAGIIIWYLLKSKY